ncbi:hypothetical protein C8Q76DRAFT_792490 [Earliella scabrosa]|nr:hypothetical protein C8Q76DRAFT_792490 [Earliella scabrosa]
MSDANDSLGWGDYLSAEEEMPEDARDFFARLEVDDGSISPRLSYDKDSAMFLLEAWEMWKEEPLHHDESASPSPRIEASNALLRLARLSARAAFLLVNPGSERSQIVQPQDIVAMEVAMGEARTYWDHLGRENSDASGTHATDYETTTDTSLGAVRLSSPPRPGANTRGSKLPASTLPTPSLPLLPLVDTLPASTLPDTTLPPSSCLLGSSVPRPAQLSSTDHVKQCLASMRAMSPSNFVPTLPPYQEIAATLKASRAKDAEPSKAKAHNKTEKAAPRARKRKHESPGPLPVFRSQGWPRASTSRPSASTSALPLSNTNPSPRPAAMHESRGRRAGISLPNVCKAPASEGMTRFPGWSMSLEDSFIPPSEFAINAMKLQHTKGCTK